MDFFEQQDIARRKTILLVLLYITGVISLLVVAGGVYFLLATALLGTATLWGLIVVEVITLLIISSSTLYRVNSLRGGGSVVAESLGGRLLLQETRNPQERVLLNVVEEMAIASGMPVPPVYVLDNDNSINAFAAGTSTQNAVIGVTRGTINTLSRDELQGVIGHEFSHIVNGDSSVNMRIIGVTFGLAVMVIIGYTIIRFSALGGSRKGQDNRNNALLFIIGMGVTFIVLGIVGQWFSSLIRAAISRQREYLADASSIQYTRNPLAIQGALNKILIASDDQQDNAKKRERDYQEISHMLFMSNFSTHPPLEERIERIEAISRIQLDTPDQVTPIAESPTSSTVTPQPAQSSQQKLQSLVGSIATVGLLGDFSIDGSVNTTYAQELLSSIPEAFTLAVHQAYSARSVIYALLLDSNQEIRNLQQQQLAKNADPDTYKTTLKLIDSLSLLKREHRLPLVEMALPVLSQMAKQQYIAFKENINTLIEADSDMLISEWLLQRAVVKHLNEVYGISTKLKSGSRNINNLSKECSTVLSALAWVEHQTHEEALNSFSKGAEVLAKNNLELQESFPTFEDIEGALTALSGIKAQNKKLFIKAAAVVLEADGNVTIEEIEMYREIANALDYPVPLIAPRKL